jgi:hypothetical protein
MKTFIFLAALFLTSGSSFADGPVVSITLTNFNGNFSDMQQVDLSWNTMMENNIDHFEIQRSGDGFNFQEIDSIHSKMMSTTNVYQLQYNYVDANPLPGISFYRVKVYGRDGYTNQSPVIQITNSFTEGTRIYPTLIQNNTVFVESDKNLKNVKIEFFDLSGNKISETNWATLNGRQNLQVSKSGKLRNGTYVARLSTNGEMIKNQMMIMQSY